MVIFLAEIWNFITVGKNAIPMSNVALNLAKYVGNVSQQYATVANFYPE